MRNKKYYSNYNKLIRIWKKKANKIAESKTAFHGDFFISNFTFFFFNVSLELFFIKVSFGKSPVFKESYFK